MWTPTRVTVQHSPSRLFRSSVLTTLLLKKFWAFRRTQSSGPSASSVNFLPDEPETASGPGALD